MAAKCSEAGCHKVTVARGVCSVHYQRLLRAGKLGPPTTPAFTQNGTWVAMRGKGWLLASEVATLIGCSERNARRILVQLTAAGRVEIIPGGEDGRADIWEALQDPRVELYDSLDHIKTQASAAMMSQNLATMRTSFRNILDLTSRAATAAERLLTPRLVPESEPEASAEPEAE